LCYGFASKDIALILSAWTWVDGSLDDGYPLIFLGPDPRLTMKINSIAAELGIEASVRIHPEVSHRDLPRLYGAAAAFVGTSFAAGGQSLRWALAAEAPVVGLKTPEFESILGEAAYLVPPGDSRSLGAACLTVLIQERVSLPLRQKGAKVASHYLTVRAHSGLVDLLDEFARPGRGAA
jgi:glycosyltransferase involved in cell wall biosynthesis